MIGPKRHYAEETHPSSAPGLRLHRLHPPQSPSSVVSATGHDARAMSMSSLHHANQHTTTASTQRAEEGYKHAGKRTVNGSYCLLFTFRSRGCELPFVFRRDERARRKPEVKQYARSSDDVVGPAASAAPWLSATGSNCGLPLLASAGTARVLFFFGLLAHNSMRLDCCGGAFFPGGIVKNFARWERVK